MRHQPVRPYVTYTFLTLCIAVTVPSLIDPGLYDVFGGIEPRRYPWQLFTAVLEHGWPGFPGIVHLGLNALLIAAAGVPCERLLGSGKFLLLSLASTTANAGVQLLGDGVNGSSLVIWSWGPPLAWGLYRAGKAEGVSMWKVNPGITGVLFIMYVAVTAAMTLLPYAFGWRGNPPAAFLLGNQYHLTATVVGALAVPWMAGTVASNAEVLAAR